MTVALVLAGNLDDAAAGLCGQLAALGVRRVDAAEQTGPGLLTVAAAARAAGERVLIYIGADSVPEPVLARLLGAGQTTAFIGGNAADRARRPAGRQGPSRRGAGGRPTRPGRAGPGRRIARRHLPRTRRDRRADRRAHRPGGHGPDP